VNNNISPTNGNLHMILGCATIAYSASTLGQYWAEDMLGSTQYQPSDIRNSWYSAATDSYYNTKPGVTITFAAAGFNSCKTETLSSTNVPGGGVYYDSVTVYTP
jgi:hypothetical protein